MLFKSYAVMYVPSVIMNAGVENVLKWASVESFE